MTTFSTWCPAKKKTSINHVWFSIQSIALPFMWCGIKNQCCTCIFISLTHSNGFHAFIIIAFLLFTNITFQCIGHYIDEQVRTKKIRSYSIWFTCEKTSNNDPRDRKQMHNFSLLLMIVSYKDKQIEQFSFTSTVRNFLISCRRRMTELWNKRWRHMFDDQSSSLSLRKEIFKFFSIGYFDRVNSHDWNHDVIRQIW